MQARRWRAFLHDALIMSAIGVGISFLPGKYDLGPWDGTTAWVARAVEWAVTITIAVVVGSRHLRRTRAPGAARRSR